MAVELKKYDYPQVLRSVFEPEDNILRVKVISGGGGGGGELEVLINHVEDSIRLGDGNNFLTSTTVGPKIALDVNLINANLDVTIQNPSIAVTGPLTNAELRASPLEVNANLDEPLKISGTEDGTQTGIEFTFVNNLRLQILASKDRDQVITYADFGTKNQRITQIDYIAPSISTSIARKTFSYTLVGTRYRRDNITWSIV